MLCQVVRVKYAFMAERKDRSRLHSMCRVLRIQRSGHYAWKKKPKSKRTLADGTLLLKIKRSFDDSQSVYCILRVHCNLREDGVLCDQKRIARLVRQAKLRSVCARHVATSVRASEWRCLLLPHLTDCNGNLQWPSPTRFGLPINQGSQFGSDDFNGW